MKNKKGFSLVELMATMVILSIVSGIVLVFYMQNNEKSKKIYYDSQEEFILLAAKDYFSTNIRLLPREIGENKNVSLEKLINIDEIKPVVDYKKKACSIEDMQKSIVYVTKINDNEFHYSMEFVCNNFTQAIDKTKPSITFNPNIDSKAIYLPIKITIKDDSDLSYISYKLDTDQISKEIAPSGNQKNLEIPLNIEGVYKISVVAIDINGNKTEVVSPKYEIDKTSTTKPILSNPIIGFTNKDVNIIVTSAIDATKTECRTSTTNYSSCNKTFKIKENTTVYARSYDKVGNVSEIASLEVGNIDKVLPNATFTLITDISDKKVVRVDATDNLSKVKQIRYRLSNNNGSTYGNWSSYINTPSFNIEIFDIGTNKIQVEVTDNALNIETFTSGVYLIKEIALPNFVLSNTAITNQNITVSIVFDETSSQKLWSFDNINWNNYTSPLTITENRKIYAKSIRGKFNSVTAQKTITNIDKIPPVINLKNISVSIFQNSYYNLVDLIESKSDNQTAVNNLFVTINPASTNTLPIGNHIITYTIRDEAGNISSATKTINIKPRQQTQFRYRNYTAKTCCVGGNYECRCRDVNDYCDEEKETCSNKTKYCDYTYDCGCSMVDGDCRPDGTCAKEPHCSTCNGTKACGTEKECNTTTVSVKCGSHESCSTCYNECLTTKDCSFWSEWSVWSTTNPGVTSTRQVETRIVDLV